MINLPSSGSIWIASKPVDMRKSHDGLAALIEKHLKQNARSGRVYVFFNKRFNRVKILYWDRNGYCLWYKRLELGRFSPPKLHQKSYQVDTGELNLLLEGIDLTTHRLRRY